MQPSAPRHKEAQGGIYETGSRSGLRDPSRPNWRQIAKAKEEKQEKDKKKKKQSQNKSKLEKEAAAKEEAWGVLTEDFKEEMRRFGTIMYINVRRWVAGMYCRRCLPSWLEFSLPVQRLAKQPLPKASLALGKWL